MTWIESAEGFVNSNAFRNISLHKEKDLETYMIYGEYTTGQVAMLFKNVEKESAILIVREWLGTELIDVEIKPKKAKK